MLDKDKLWIACYINTGLLNDEEVYNYLSEVSKHFSELENDGSVKYFFFPIRNGEDKDTKMQCIYDPTHGSNEEYEKFFKEAQDYLNTLVTNKKTE